MQEKPGRCGMIFVLGRRKDCDGPNFEEFKSSDATSHRFEGRRNGFYDADISGDGRSFCPPGIFIVLCTTKVNKVSGIAMPLTESGIRAPKIWKRADCLGIGAYCFLVYGLTLRLVLPVFSAAVNKNVPALPPERFRVIRFMRD